MVGSTETVNYYRKFLIWAYLIYGLMSFVVNANWLHKLTQSDELFLLTQTKPALTDLVLPLEETGSPEVKLYLQLKYWAHLLMLTVSIPWVLMALALLRKDLKETADLPKLWNYYGYDLLPWIGVVTGMFGILTERMRQYIPEEKDPFPDSYLGSHAFSAASCSLYFITQGIITYMVDTDIALEGMIRQNLKELEKLLQLSMRNTKRRKSL